MDVWSHLEHARRHSPTGALCDTCEGNPQRQFLPLAASRFVKRTRYCRKPQRKAGGVHRRGVFSNAGLDTLAILTAAIRHGVHAGRGRDNPVAEYVHFVFNFGSMPRMCRNCPKCCAGGGPAEAGSGTEKKSTCKLPSTCSPHIVTSYPQRPRRDPKLPKSRQVVHKLSSTCPALEIRPEFSTLRPILAKIWSAFAQIAQMLDPIGRNLAERLANIHH